MATSDAPKRRTVVDFQRKSSTVLCFGGPDVPKPKTFAKNQWFAGHFCQDPTFADFCTILVVFLYGFWRAIQGVRNDVAPEVFLTPRARGVNN